MADLEDLKMLFAEPGDKEGKDGKIADKEQLDGKKKVPEGEEAASDDLYFNIFAEDLPKAESDLYFNIFAEDLPKAEADAEPAVEDPDKEDGEDDDDDADADFEFAMAELDLEMEFDL